MANTTKLEALIRDYEEAIAARDMRRVDLLRVQVEREAVRIDHEKRLFDLHAIAEQSLFAPAVQDPVRQAASAAAFLRATNDLTD